MPLYFLFNTTLILASVYIEIGIQGLEMCDLVIRHRGKSDTEKYGKRLKLRVIKKEKL